MKQAQAVAIVLCIMSSAPALRAEAQSDSAVTASMVAQRRAELWRDSISANWQERVECDGFFRSVVRPEWTTISVAVSFDRDSVRMPNGSMLTVAAFRDRVLRDQARMDTLEAKYEARMDSAEGLGVHAPEIRTVPPSEQILVKDLGWMPLFDALDWLAVRHQQ